MTVLAVQQSAVAVSQGEDGAETIVPVDLHVPGCPPHPYTILDGLLRLLGRLADKR